MLEADPFWKPTAAMSCLSIDSLNPSSEMSMTRLATAWLAAARMKRRFCAETPGAYSTVRPLMAALVAMARASSLASLFDGISKTML